MKRRIVRAGGLALAAVLALFGAGAAFGMSRADLGIPDDAVRNEAAQLRTSFRRGDFARGDAALRRLVRLALGDRALMRRIPEIVVLIPDGSYSNAVLPYAAARLDQGFAVTVHDLAAEIGGAPDPHQIRRLLQSRYADRRMRYLIIVGDEERVPMLPTYAAMGEPVTWTDFYYADLEGDWDADGDGVYGEAAQDRIDFIPEFIVGRIPAATPDEARAALDRALYYRGTRSAAKNRGILMAGTILVQGESGLLQNFIHAFLARRQFQTVRIYDTDTFQLGDVGIPLNPDYVYGETSVPEVWNAGACGFVFDVSHGYEYGVKGFDFDEIALLEPAFPGYFVAAACATSLPVPGRNFSEQMLFQGGCAGVIGSSNVVHPGEGLRLVSGVFGEVGFALAAAEPNLPLGQALNAMRVMYYLLFMADEEDPEWLELFAQNLKGYTFYGDPEVPLRTWQDLKTRD